MLQRVMLRFSVENFLSRSTETFRRGTRKPSVLCFRKLLVAKKFMDKREGEVSKFSVENFLSQSAKKGQWGKPFSLSLNSGIEKSYASEGYVTIFRQKLFVSQYRNIS